MKGENADEITSVVADGSHHSRESDYLRAVQDENVAELHSIQAESPTHLHLRYVCFSQLQFVSNYPPPPDSLSHLDTGRKRSMPSIHTLQELTHTKTFSFKYKLKTRQQLNKGRRKRGRNKPLRPVFSRPTCPNSPAASTPVFPSPLSLKYSGVS